MSRQAILCIGFALTVAAAFLPGPEPAHAQQRPTLTREVAPPGTEPYATTFVINVVSGSGANGYSSDPVPANRRLVIEFVSVSTILDTGQTPLFSLQDSIAGISNAYVLPLTLVSSGSGGDLYRATQLVRLYHDGNGASGPGAQCSRNQNAFSSFSCTVTISGYLIPTR